MIDIIENENDTHLKPDKTSGLAKPEACLKVTYSFLLLKLDKTEMHPKIHRNSSSNSIATLNGITLVSSTAGNSYLDWALT